MGPDSDGYLARLKKLASNLGVERFFFHDAVFGDNKKKAFEDADLYVLPSLSENFGMTVAESLAHGVPVIVSRGAPWKGVETNGCGWWVDIGAEPLAECLRNAMNLSRADLSSRGERGREWMQRDYGWDHIGDMMRDAYGWLLGGGARPGFIDVK